jgi:hypothetical protein
MQAATRVSQIVIDIDETGREAQRHRAGLRLATLGL